MAVAALLVVVIRPANPPAGRDAVRGHRVFAGLRPPADAVTIAWEGRTLRAEHGAGGWRIDGRDAGRVAADALDDMVETLVRLRAIDAFRPRDGAAYGLDSPRGTIDIESGGRSRRLVVGGVNAAASAFYAQRDGDGRVLEVGSGLGSLLERVLYASGRQRPDSG